MYFITNFFYEVSDKINFNNINIKINKVFFNKNNLDNYINEKFNFQINNNLFKNYYNNYNYNLNIIIFNSEGLINTNTIFLNSPINNIFYKHLYINILKNKIIKNKLKVIKNNQNDKILKEYIILNKLIKNVFNL